MVGNRAQGGSRLVGRVPAPALPLSPSSFGQNRLAASIVIDRRIYPIWASTGRLSCRIVVAE